MQSKRKAVLWVLAAAFLSGLLIVSLFARNLNCRDLLLVAPVSSSSSEIDGEKLEEVNGESFLLTYEILSGENLKALNSNYDVTLRATNYTYRYIMNYSMLSGSFFTEEDQKEKKKSAVLNQTAAYTMFGNIDVGGDRVVVGSEEYTISGVMDDGDDEQCNVYIPAACSGRNPDSFAVQLSGGVKEELVKNECKSLTIPESGYVYIPFGNLVNIVSGLFFAGIKLAILGIFLFILKKGGNRLKESMMKARELSEQFYFKDLLHHHSGEILKAALILTAMILIIVLSLNLAFGFVGYILIWNDSIPFVWISDPSVFGRIASSLEHCIYLSAFFLLGFFLDAILILLFQRSEAEKREGSNR